MDKSVLATVVRFWLVLFFQIFVFKGMGENIGGVDVYIYPVFIMLLPLSTPLAFVLLLSFAYGLAIDAFYDSNGLHAASLTLVGFERFFLGSSKPRRRYEVYRTPSRRRLQFRRFISHSVKIMGIHSFAVITLEELSFSSVWVLRFLLTFSLSSMFVVLYYFIFNRT